MNRTCLTLVLGTLVLGTATLPAAAQETGQPSFFVTSKGIGDGGNLGGLAGADAFCNSTAAAAGLTGDDWKAYLSTQGDGAVNARDRIGSGPWYNVKGVQIAASVDDLHNQDSVNISEETALDETGQILPTATMAEVMARRGGGAGGAPGGAAPGGAPPAGAPPAGGAPGGAPPAGGPAGGPPAGGGTGNGPPAGFQIDPNAQMSYEHDILTGSQADGTAFPASGGDETCANWTSNSDGKAMLGHSDRSSFTPGEKSPWNAAHDSAGCSQPQLVSTGGAGRLYCFLPN